MEHEGDNYTNRDWCFWFSHQRIMQGSGGLGGWRIDGDHPNYNIIKNTVKTPGDLLSLKLQWKAKTDVKNS